MLLQSRERSQGNDENMDFSAGDYVLLLKVYLKFGKYLAKVNDIIVKLQRAAVSIERVAHLLNLPEHRSLFASETPPTDPKEAAVEGRIELQSIGFVPPKRGQGLGPLG